MQPHERFVCRRHVKENMSDQTCTQGRLLRPGSREPRRCPCATVCATKDERRAGAPRCGELNRSRSMSAEE
jgi:hypothetical protein